mmetsp:Transcript_23059/g.65544  ORF Transcript_23059/g.65544 Transcript_23059/m.65544 type:complete len:721 (-) Transcript_23059:82-2244(-)
MPAEAFDHGSSRRRLEDAQAQDGYVERHDLGGFASGVAPGQASPAGDDRLQGMRRDAAQYIERFDLRQVLQDMFQKVIRERPVDPFDFMREHLEAQHGGDSKRRKAEEELAQQRAEVDALRRRLVDLEAAAAAASRVSNVDRSDLQREYSVYEEQVKQQRSLLEQRFNQQVEEERSAMQRSKAEELERQRAELAQQHASQMEHRRIEFEKTLETYCTTLEALRSRTTELEKQAESASKAAEEEKAAMAERHEQEVKQFQGHIDTLQRQVQPADGAAGVASDRPQDGRQSPADAAAGGVAERSGALPSFSKTGQTQAPTTTTTTMAYTGSFAPGSEFTTQMLHQLLASTFAPSAKYGSLEEEEEGACPSSPAVLVRITKCEDASSNGVFAWVGECHSRPMYRLLGPEPRYLHYVDKDIASGWVIVDRMGTQEPTERFLKPTDAEIPIACEVGEKGGRVSETRLTRAIVGRISMISSLEEKDAIRAKLNQEFGAAFQELEVSQRGLLSRAGPVLAVARALEAQQRSIQLLHTQLSSEAQRREAAETHARTMEEAFETLQLRIQTQLASPPTVAALQELSKAAMPPASPSYGGASPGVTCRDLPGGDAPDFETHSRALILQQDGNTAWGPDLGPGQGPAPPPKVPPKETKPVPPPTFRRLPSGLRNRLANGELMPCDGEGQEGAIGDVAAQAADAPSGAGQDAPGGEAGAPSAAGDGDAEAAP